jgi:hypothetical protein
MTSQIDPNSINNEYPVAGQDNSTQGFRDNFSFIKINFGAAKDEITDLQNKVLLKSALTGTVLDNNLNDAPLYGARIQNFSAAQTDLGSISGSLPINYAVGHYQIFSINNGVNLSFTNFPPLGSFAWIVLRIQADAGDTLTLPLSVSGTGPSKSLQGIQGLSGQTITFAETGTYEYEFRTVDAGVTVYISELTRPKNLWTNPLFVTGDETVANLANISLTTATSFFNVANTDQRANLAAGANGQVKVLALAAKGTGNVTVTVSNAGWKPSGTGTAQLTVLGSACTLQYFNNKWYCIGNNGAAFA